jgi:ABC-type antimicrobial peptide transport system permease subunit
MKGQFFIISSVIIVFSLAGLITYVYDFGSIHLTKVSVMGELDYITYIKTVLNKTVHSSYSSNDCYKVDMDVNSTIDYLKKELVKKGIILTVNYVRTCPAPDFDFTFNIKTTSLYTETNFRITV